MSHRVKRATVFSFTSTLYLATAFCFSPLARAQSTESEEISGLKLAQFRGGVVYATQGSGTSSVAPLVSWNPEQRLAPEFSVLGQFGASGLLSYLGDRFPVLEYAFLAQYSPIQPLSLELGGGGQFWQGKGGNRNFGVVLANAVYHFAQPIFYMDAFWLGAGITFVPKHTTTLIRCGVQF